MVSCEFLLRRSLSRGHILCLLLLNGTAFFVGRTWAFQRNQILHYQPSPPAHEQAAVTPETSSLLESLAALLCLGVSDAAWEQTRATNPPLSG